MRCSASATDLPRNRRDDGFAVLNLLLLYERPPSSAEFVIWQHQKTRVCNSHCRKATKCRFFQLWELQIPKFIKSRIRRLSSLRLSRITSTIWRSNSKCLSPSSRLDRTARLQLSVTSNIQIDKINEVGFCRSPTFFC